MGRERRCWRAGCKEGKEGIEDRNGKVNGFKENLGLGGLACLLGLGR